MKPIKIIRTTPHDGKMVPPGASLTVDDGLARALKQAGKAIDPPSAKARASGKARGVGARREGEDDGARS